MKSFIIFTFILLGVVFYEMSGGADFDPAASKPIFTKSDQTTAPPVRRQTAQVSVAAEPQADAVVSSQTGMIPGVSMRQLSTLATSDRLTVGANEDGVMWVSFVPQDLQIETPAIVEPQPKDLRQVTAARVNVRSGPGTRHSVIGQLSRNETAEVIDDTGTGWVQIRTGNGQNGWMSARFLAVR